MAKTKKKPKKVAKKKATAKPKKVKRTEKPRAQKPKKVRRALEQAKKEIKKVAKKIKKTLILKIAKSLPKNFKFTNRMTGAVAITNGKRTLTVVEQLKPVYEGKGNYCRAVYEGGKLLGVTTENTAIALGRWFRDNLPEADIPRVLLSKTSEGKYYTVSDYTSNPKKRCTIKKIREGFILKDIEAMSLGDIRQLSFNPKGKVREWDDATTRRVENMANWLMERTKIDLGQIEDLTFEWDADNEQLYVLTKDYTKPKFIKDKKLRTGSKPQKKRRVKA